jgi:hypothetical protein
MSRKEIEKPMFNDKLDREKIKVLRLLEEILEVFLNQIKPHLKDAKGELNMLAVKPGTTGILFTFSGLDQFGKIFKLTKPVEFSSDNLSVATVDSTQQTVNADGTISVPVVAVAANADGSTGVAHITGKSDPADGNASASDELDVTAVVVVSVLTSATGVLSVSTPAATAAKPATQVAGGKNPLAL